jgi:hypothetical protein
MLCENRATRETELLLMNDRMTTIVLLRDV